MRSIRVHVDRIVTDAHIPSNAGREGTAALLAAAIRSALAAPSSGEQREGQPLLPDEVAATVRRAVRSAFG